MLPRLPRLQNGSEQKRSSRKGTGISAAQFGLSFPAYADSLQFSISTAVASPGLTRNCCGHICLGHCACAWRPLIELAQPKVEQPQLAGAAVMCGPGTRNCFLACLLDNEADHLSQVHRPPSHDRSHCNVQKSQLSTATHGTTALQASMLAGAGACGSNI